jgi:hypothetical protein
MNPKLAPKLTNDAPDDPMNKYVLETTSREFTATNKSAGEVSQTLSSRRQQLIEVANDPCRLKMHSPGSDHVPYHPTPPHQSRPSLPHDPDLSHVAGGHHRLIE